MNRRGFLKMLGLAVAGAATGVAAFPETPKADANAINRMLKEPVRLGINSRGRGTIEAGYVFAPYIPVFMTPQIHC